METTTKTIRTKFIQDRPLPPSTLPPSTLPPSLPAKQRMPQANWSDKHKELFLEILLELKKNGDIGQDNSIKKAGWTTIVQEFNKAANVNYVKEQLQTCLQNMKKKYDAFHKVKHLSGLGWDDELEEITCGEDEWNRYVEYNKDAKEFRHKALVNYDLMDEYFHGTCATGEFASASGTLGHKGKAVSRSTSSTGHQDGTEIVDDPPSQYSTSSTGSMSLGEPCFHHDILDIVAKEVANATNKRQLADMGHGIFYGERNPNNVDPLAENPIAPFGNIDDL